MYPANTEENLVLHQILLQENMNILFIGHLFPNRYESNSGTFNISRIKALIERGHRVKAVIPVSVIPPIKYLGARPDIKMMKKYYGSFKPIYDFDVNSGFECITVSWFPVPSAIMWPYQSLALNISAGMKIKSICRNFSPDLILLSVLNPEGAFSRYLRKATDSVLFSIAEGSEILVYPEIYKGIEKICSIADKYCDKVVFVSESMNESAQRLYPFKNHIVIANGYDQEHFSFSEESVRRDGRFTIVSAGNLEYVKGHDILIEAVKDIEDVKLVIAGRGFLEREYSERIRNLGLKDKIELAGYLSPGELRKYYARADIFCLPSRSEGFGIAAIEAMACGLPVIAPPVGEMPNVIENEVTGLMLKKLSQDHIKDAICRAKQIIWDRRLISSRVSGKYGWKQWAAEIERAAVQSKLNKSGFQAFNQMKGEN